MPVNLPPEILGITFCYLDPFSLLRVSHTCAQWREIVKSIDSQLKSQVILEDNTLLFDSLGPNFNAQFKSALVLRNIKKRPLKVSEIRHGIPTVKSTEPLPEWFGGTHVEVDQSPSTVDQGSSEGYLEYIESTEQAEWIQVTVRNNNHEAIASGTLEDICHRSHVQADFVAKSVLFVHTMGECLKAYSLPELTLLFTTNQSPGSVLVNDNYLCIPPCSDCPHYPRSIRVLPLQSPDQWYTVASTSLSRFYSASFKNITISARYICVTLTRRDTRWYHYLVLIDLYTWTASAYLVLDQYGKWCINWSGKVLYMI